MRTTFFVIALFLGLTSSMFGQGNVSVDLAFMSHLDMDLAEQDVYIEREPGSGEVWRVTRGDHNMNAPLYTAAEFVPHDPFNPDALGPYKIGKPMGLTLGQWLKHQGTGTYTCEDGTGTLKLKFTGLIPNGVYTLWHFFIPIPPPVPFTGTLDLPLGARDGSESMFVADANGNAEFDHSFAPCLQMSDVWAHTGIALNYHSDGKIYGGHPGEFGSVSHLPMIVLLPMREGIDTRAAAAEK